MSRRFLGLLALVGVAFAAAAAATPCVNTHAEWARTSTWPVLPQSLVCGAATDGKTLNGAAPRITWGAVLAEPAHDAWGRLAAQWVAAQLNTASNRDAPVPPHIHNTMLDARALLSAHCAARTTINVAHSGTLMARLEAYNKGADGTLAACTVVAKRAVASIASRAQDGDNDDDNNNNHGGTGGWNGGNGGHNGGNGNGGHNGGNGNGGHNGGWNGDHDGDRSPTTTLVWYSIIALIGVFLIGACTGGRVDYD